MEGIRDVAVIGAGPSGLASAKYLLAEKNLNVQVFEQRDTVGGVWGHNSLTVLDDDFTIPRTHPTTIPDNPITTPGSKTPKFVSPVYDSLETNIPHTLMNYSDQPFPIGTSLFPRHAVVKQYLDRYAEELKPHTSLSTQIVRVGKVDADGQKRWAVETLNLRTKEANTTHFDAILVATGHYNDPFIPDIPGLAEFSKAHPSSVSHSKFFKNASYLRNKKVIVVGNSASGIDLSNQVSRVCKLPVIVSEKTSSMTPPADDNAWADYKPEIVEFIPQGRSVRFSNGDIESGVDHILFCTGYFYSFPFLQTLSPPVVTDGSSARNLYQHMLYTHDPTLAFIGIPQRIVPFPVAEAQAAWISRLWAGRLPTPDPSEMMSWEARSTDALDQGAPLHILKFPKDRDYINMLHKASSNAVSRAGLENGGAGKVPPYWDEEKAWVRERFPAIKVASRKLGDQRHLVTSLAQLGFDYPTGRAERAAASLGLLDQAEVVLPKEVKTAA